MTRHRLVRWFRSTIARSRTALPSLFIVAAGASIPVAAQSPADSPSQETPPPHARDAADDPGEASVPEHPLPDPRTSVEVTLGGLLAYADQRSPVLIVARSTRSRAEANQAAASVRGLANPQLSVSAGPRLGVDATGLDVEVGLSQQIQIGGERRRRMDAADRFDELTEAEIEQIRWAVHCDVHAAFHRALVEREKMQLAERVTSFQEDVLRVVERQITAGETAPLSLRLAQAEVAQARQVQVAFTQSFLAARIQLAQLAGWPASTPPMPTGALDEPRDPPAHAHLVEIAQERLPSLLAGMAAVREAEARVAAADRNAWARPTIGIQYRREGNPTSEGPYSIVMGNVSIPIPSFQRNQGERASARADVTVAEAELDATRALLDGRIATARSEVVAAAQRTRAYGTEIIPRFEENLLLLRRSFELGEIDILSLSVGRERFLRIQSDALLAQLDYFVATAALERVVGVDLWRDADHEGTSP